MGHTSQGSADVFLRVAATLFSMVGLMLMLKDHQAIHRDVAGASVGTQLGYSDATGLLFLLYTNGLVAIYCFVVAMTSALALINRVHIHKLGAWVVFIVDQGLAYVLLSAASSATEILYLSVEGDEHASWAEICSTYGHFCRMLRMSIGASFLSVVALATISVISAKHLFSKYAILKGVVRIKALPES